MSSVKTAMLGQPAPAQRVWAKQIHHRDTEDTEIAQRKPKTIQVNSLRILCVLCVSVVNLDSLTHSTLVFTIQSCRKKFVKQFFLPPV
jgi:hypothetical protein